MNDLYCYDYGDWICTTRTDWTMKPQLGEQAFVMGLPVPLWGVQFWSDT